MLSNSLPNSIDRRGVANDCIARDDRSVISNLTKHHFKMGDLLCGRTTLNRRDFFGIVSESTKRRSVSFFLPCGSVS